MFVYPHIKTVFVAIPKTATRSIAVYLKQRYPVIKLAEHQALIPDQYKDFFSFAVVRNPYERICSLYWSMCRRDNSHIYRYVKLFNERKWDNTLENFLLILEEQKLRPLHQQPQHAWLTKRNNISQVIHYETLQEDFSNLPFIKDDGKLPRNNSTTEDRTRLTSTKRPFWKDMVTVKEGKLINKLYKRDFELLDYEMENFK